MEAPRPTAVTQEELDKLAENRSAFDQRLDEIREGNKIRAESLVREQGGAVIRIAAQGD